MSSSDFRELAVKGDVSKSERLFRAAISAFCSLTRPARRDATQLDDLTLPLFDAVSIESRRYVAAALSECEIAPLELVRRLCDEPVDICAPLLIRSRALTDVDLIALLGRHGLGHARAIARRPGLGEAITNLVRALEGAVSIVPMPEGNVPVAGDAVPVDGAAMPRLRAADDVRHRLRMMMRPEFEDYGGATIRPVVDPSCYAKLRDTAMTGNPTFFQTALADALKLNFRAARSITETSSLSPLLAALRSLDLGEEQAFLIASAVFARSFPHPEAIRLFLDRYRSLSREAAQERVRGWKLDMVSTWISENAHPGRASNIDRLEPPVSQSRLTA